MSEKTSNIEFAHRIHEIREQGHDHGPSGWARWMSITEAVVLSIVAVATAWSGYEAARWDAASTRQYTNATDSTMRSQVNAMLAGQDRLYDIVTFNGWVAAENSGQPRTCRIL